MLPEQFDSVSIHGLYLPMQLTRLDSRVQTGYI